MKWSLILLVTSSAYYAEAETQFKAAPTCGSAKVINADKCDQAKVEFNFNGCLFNSPPKTATKVECKNNLIVGRFANDQFRYEITFEKSEDGWGGSDWKAKGGVKQWQAEVEKKPIAAIPTKIESPAKTAVAPANESERTNDKPMIESKTPAAIAPPLPADSQFKAVASAAETKSTLTFGGFVDIRLSSLTVKDQPTWNGNSESGYTIEDGKLALDYVDGDAELIVDIPFRRAKATDLDPSLSPPDYGSPNSTVLFGTDKTQIFGKYKFNDHLSSWIGQFDTLFGVEFNDSKDRIFSKTGLLYDEMLPVTHTGLLLETGFNGLSVKGFSANANNKGSLGQSASGDNNYEYGATLGFSNESIRIQAGGMNRAIFKSDGSKRSPRNLLDLTIGGTINWFSIDLEYTQINDPSKNVLTVDSSDIETPGTGVMALVSLTPIEKWSLGLRYENLQNAPSASSEKVNMSSQSINLKRTLQKNLETRFEYDHAVFERLDHTKWNTDRGIFSIIYSF